MSYSAIEFYSGISHGFGYEYAKIVYSDGSKLSVGPKEARAILKKYPSLSVTYIEEN
jgi:hypothetical protein